MRRFLSIVTCSAALVASSFGQTYNWTNVGTQLVAVRNGFLQFGASTTLYGAYLVWEGGSNSTTFRWRNTSLQPEYAPNVQRTSVFEMSGRAARSYTASAPDAGMPTTTFYWNGTNISFDSLATNSFSWTFGPEWAGTILQIRATNGTALGTWGLPATIGPGGYVLSSSIVTNQSLLTGAQVFLDGASAASLAMARTNSNLNGFADRPGYEFEFDSSFSGGLWQIRRQDGSVAASGSAATLGSVVSGRVTVLPEGSQGTIWTQVSPGDGLPAQWVNSGYTVQGNNVTLQFFASTGTPAPQSTPSLPQPTPAPGASPAPTPGSATGGSSVTPTTDPSTNVSVTITNAIVPSMDAGEQGVLDKIDSMNDKFAQGLEDFGLAYQNIGLTFNEFRKLVLTPPGRTCELQFGPVSISLSSMIPGWVREASKLVFLFAGVAAMWRFITWTFSS